MPNMAENVEQRRSTAEIDNSLLKTEAFKRENIFEGASERAVYWEAVYRKILKRSLDRKSDGRNIEEKERHAFALATRFCEPEEDATVFAPRGDGDKEAQILARQEELLAPMLKDYADRRTDEAKRVEARRQAEWYCGSAAERFGIGPLLPEKKLRIWHKFSKSLATEINEEQPDITAALLVYGIGLWMGAAETGVRKLDYCYRSLSELEEDYPYLTEACISKALKRAAKKIEGFELIATKKVMRFKVTKKLRKRLQADEKLMFRVGDAVLYGLNEAILLSNLTWQVTAPAPETYVKRPVGYKEDDQGVRYYEMSATTLSQVHPYSREAPILPMSRWTINRALKELRLTHQVVVQHASFKSYYALTSQFASNHSLQPPAGANRIGAEVNDAGAEVNNSGAEVNDSLCVYSKEIEMGYSKENILSTASASPLLCGGHLSDLGKKLMEVFCRSTEAYRVAQKAQEGKRHKYITVPASQLPYDVIHHPSRDLPYDVFPTVADGTIYTRHDQIRDEIAAIAEGWRFAKFKYTKAHLKELEALFVNVPEFTIDEFDDVRSHLIPNRLPIFGPRDFDPPPKGKHDSLFFARKVKDAATLLKYLPELIEEMHEDPLAEATYEDGNIVRDSWIPKEFQAVIDYYRTPKQIPKEYVEHDCNPMGTAA